MKLKLKYLRAATLLTVAAGLAVVRADATIVARFQFTEANPQYTAGAWTNSVTTDPLLTVGAITPSVTPSTMDPFGLGYNNWIAAPKSFTFNLTVPAGYYLSLDSWTFTQGDDGVIQVKPTFALGTTGAEILSLGSVLGSDYVDSYSYYQLQDHTKTLSGAALYPGTYTFTLSGGGPSTLVDTGGGNGSWIRVAGLTLNGTVALIPEPSTIVLLGVGGSLIWRYARKKK